MSNPACAVVGSINYDMEMWIKQSALPMSTNGVVII